MRPLIVALLIAAIVMLVPGKSTTLAAGVAPNCITTGTGGCYLSYHASYSFYDPSPNTVTISTSWTVDRDTGNITYITPSLTLPSGYSRQVWLQQGTVPSTGPITEIYQYTYVANGQTYCHSVQMTVNNSGNSWAPSSPGGCTY